MAYRINNRPDEFISIRHLGTISNGIEDTSSEAVRAWAPAYENYTFIATPTGARLVVDQDVTDDFEAYLAAAWPRALESLKALCEAADGAVPQAAPSLERQSPQDAVLPGRSQGSGKP